MLRKPLAIGIDDYKKLFDKGCYYVDKSLLIKELLDKPSEVYLFTRPRRFGKTLTLSMVRTFFELDSDVEGKIKDNHHYFKGMKIMNAGERYTDHMGKYPVIVMSLKSAKQPDYSMAYESILDEIIREYERHRYVLEGGSLLTSQCEKYTAIMERRAEPIAYAKSLGFLSECLKIYHKKDVIILIDEYDVPLENSYFEGFYDKMIGFIRSLFESALKSNDSLEFAIITGCLNVAPSSLGSKSSRQVSEVGFPTKFDCISLSSQCQSVFTGLNNLEVISILNENYAEYFGFTQAEVEDMLDFYGIGEKRQEVRRWYDGYLFGNIEVYNPWSLINYVKTEVTSTTALPKPYWSNTSSNNIIRELIENADMQAKQEIESLIGRGTIEKPVHEDITYEDIHKSQDNLWNFLFFTGYLKKVRERQEERTIYITFAIPNEETAYIYENFIHEWFDRRLKTINLTRLYNAVISGDCDTFGAEVTNQLIETISVFDYAENYYHGFLAGLLKGCPGYIILSNRESGNGRPDLILKSPSVRGTAILMELKVVNRFEKMEEGCDRALEQIKQNNYEAELRREGYQKFEWYGICFYRKECMVKSLTIFN